MEFGIGETFLQFHWTQKPSQLRKAKRMQFCTLKHQQLERWSQMNSTF